MTLGFRPEDLFLASDATGGRCLSRPNEAALEVAEPTVPPMGTPLGARIDLARMHLFGRDTGVSLAAREANVVV